MNHLKNKRILITGASSGIGRALAFRLAEKDAELILSARHLEQLNSVAGMIGEKNPNILKPLAIPCDLRKTDEIRKLFNECMKQHKTIDILINNAGVGLYGETNLTTIEDHRAIMEVNYFGAVGCMLEALPIMLKRKEGLIVNICSVAAIHGIPYLGVYCASKAALMAITQSMRAELSKYGISFMVVYPGYTQTDFFDREKRVGKAFRPKGPYKPAEEVIGKIIYAIENNLPEQILTFEGKALAFSRVIFPGMVREKMKKIANELMIQPI